MPRSPTGTLGLGGSHGTKLSQPASIEPLSAWNYRYQITDPKVRQITIDLHSLTNVASADLDVVGRTAPVANGPRDPWHRVRSSADVLTLCRDVPTENFNLFYSGALEPRGDAEENYPDLQRQRPRRLHRQTKDACDAPDHYDVNFHGFSVVGDTWTGSATFDLVGAASDCNDPAHFPPTTDDVRYCYTLRNGGADWQYTDPQGGSTTTSVVLSPSTDVGTIELRVRSVDPQKVRTYYANILPGTLKHLMPTAGGSRDAADKVIAWVATYADGSGSLRIGDGYQFAGSARLCAGPDCQGWTWDFTPRWDPRSP